MGKTKKTSPVFWLIGTAGLVGCFLFSLFMGRFTVAPAEVLQALKKVLTGQEAEGIQQSVVIGIRLPRTLMAMLVGAGLSVSGAAFQGLFQNPLVSPDVLGVSSGAALGAVIGILLAGYDYTAMTLAFAFGVATVLITYALSRLNGKSTVLSLVLGGMITSALMNACISLCKYAADPVEKLPAITYWLMGSFSSANYALLKLVCLPVLAGIAIIFALRWRINVLSLGDEECMALGIRPGFTRGLIIFASTMITAACVMATGIIGWVGLVIPHITRMLVGVDHKYQIPGTVLLGAIFMTLVDVASRTMLAAEIPIGVLTALIGAPFFAVVYRKKGLS